MDRDFVLAWRPVADAVPRAALFMEQVGAEHYGLLMVLPPAPDRAGDAPPRELVFVVDTSGSMGGVSIEQARASVSLALRQLRPEDRFNVIEFDSSFRSLYRTPVPATRHHVQRAQEFVRQLAASGGTEMLPALIAALDPPVAPDLHREQPILRQVIFITDGAVGNEAALFEEIAHRLGDSRLFTVGIGSAPNSWFMRKAAEFGRGSHTHIGALNEVGDRMSALFEQLSRPAAVGVSVAWPQGAEVWPERLPDLYLGQPLLAAVNFGPGLPTGELLVSGDIGGQQWQQRLLIPGGGDPAAVADHPGVASLWARQKITGILDQRVAGRGEQEVRQDVLEVALEHQLLSPYTSFVAIEEVVSRPGDEELASKPVANTRPRGQSPQYFAYPSGSTTGPVQLWFGLLLLFAALMTRAMREGTLERAPV
jgi:Ca-activated chloride channel family protein